MSSVVTPLESFCSIGKGLLGLVQWFLSFPALEKTLRIVLPASLPQNPLCVAEVSRVPGKAYCRVREDAENGKLNNYGTRAINSMRKGYKVMVCVCVCVKNYK